ncbi:MAG: hypothetical protein HY717_08330 [Planctomycetes bacterium]|nr:hypothetical protein [Planctomycetota bacterium]
MSKQKAESRDGYIGINVSLPPDLHRKLAIASIEDQIAMVEILRRASIEWLKNRERERKKARAKS